jgi:GT2 family glycosyltransferase
VQSTFLDENPETVAVSSRTMRIDEQGLSTGLVKLPAGLDIRPALLLSNVVPHSALMFRRKIGEQVGSYNTELHQMEDYDFVLRLAGRGPIAQLEDPLVTDRVHSSQTSRGAKPFGRHIRRVLRGRRDLSRVLGRSPLVGFVKNMAWIGVQYLRYFGAIRPGHER